MTQELHARVQQIARDCDSKARPAAQLQKDCLELNVSPMLPLLRRTPQRRPALIPSALCRAGPQELLLRAMLSLDDVDSGGDDRIRQYRRSTVKAIDGYNGELDAVKRKLGMPQ